jgi:hypothetical protein
MDRIYDKADGSSTAAVPIKDYAEAVGLDNDGAYTLLYYCRDHGFVSDRASAMGHPSAILTSCGIADVHAPAARNCCAGSTGSALHRCTCRSTVMFAETDDALFEGVRFANAEIDDAAEYLSVKGLVRGTIVDQNRGPVRAEITTDGIDCVTDWTGDLPKYLRDQRGYGPTYNGPVVHGNADGDQWA